MIRSLLATLLLAACGAPPPAQTTVDVPPIASTTPPPATIASPPEDGSTKIRFHDGTWLLVYGVPKPRDDSAFFDVMGTELRLARFDPKTSASSPLGRIRPMMGSNSAGIFVPIAISRDDKLIIVDAHMGTPGAGGGNIDYGYGIVPVKRDLDVGGVDGVDEVADFASRNAVFLDDHDTVVYVDEGDDTPHYTKPGPSNAGAIHLRRVGSKSPVALLAERDTSYKLLVADAATRTVKYEAKKYVFSSSCPREDNALGCAQFSITRAVLRVP